MSRKVILGGSVLALVSAALLVGIGGPAPQNVAEIPHAGPILAGDWVVWAVSPEEESQLRVWKSGESPKLVYRVGPSTTKRGWGFSDLSSSGSRVAFNRSWTVCPPSTPKEPKGDYVYGPDCYHVGADTVAGEIGRQFDELPRTRCPNDRSGDFDIAGGLAVYVESNCDDEGGEIVRVVVHDPASGATRVIRKADGASSSCCDAVRAAGRYVAWSDDLGEEAWSIPVYDLEAGHVSYRAHAGKGGRYAGRLKLDVQADGKLLVAHQSSTLGVMFARLAWFSPEEPTLHALPFRNYIPEGGSWDVRLARDEFAFERLVESGRSELVIANLQGDVVARLASFGFPTRERWGDFDFDGERIVWAERQVTERSAVECPPSNIHCPTREDGWITMFLAERRDGWSAKRIMRAPFTSYRR